MQFSPFELTGNVLDNGSDPEGDPLTATLVHGSTHGTLVLAADGSFSYTPDPDFTGKDTFTYQAVEGSQDEESGTVAKALAVSEAPSSEPVTVTIEVKAVAEDEESPTAPPSDEPADEPNVQPTKNAPVPPADNGKLGDTGSDVSAMTVVMGGLALLVGAGMLILGRRTR